jgi:hypothetical protein
MIAFQLRGAYGDLSAKVFGKLIAVDEGGGHK